MLSETLPGKFKVSYETVIDATKEVCWEVLRDFNNVYTWVPAVKVSHGIGSVDTGVGAGRHCKIEGFGKIDEYIQEWQEGDGFIYDVTPLGPLGKSYSRWLLTSLSNDKTQLSIVFSYDIRFGVFGMIMHKLVMRKKLEASLPEVSKSFKERVEQGKLVRPLIRENHLKNQKLA